ncbi:MAG: hypothetical protein EPO12_17800 [Aquabacterium sp.]|jgi:hypothetical protein|nr:MAG: hypothetical protein EPO12_17800 [Aquabacterium sp.]
MGYEQRTTELRQRFDFFKATMTPEDWAPLSAALDVILKAREEGLAALGEILADKGDNPRRDAYDSKLDELSKAQLEQVQNLLQTIKPQPPNLIVFRDVAAAEEARFWAGLKTAAAGAARDDQMKAMHDLEWFTAIMRARWKNLSDTEKDLLQKERYYAAQLRETVKKGFEEATSEAAQAARDGLQVLSSPERAKKVVNEKYQEVLKSLYQRVGGDPKKIEAFIKNVEEKKQSVKQAAEQAGLDPDIAGKVIDALTKPGGLLATLVFDGLSLVYNPLGGIAKTVSKAAKALEPVAQSVIDGQVADIRALMGGRQTVIVTFSTTRREAREYVEKNGYEQAKQLYQNNRQALETWQAALKDALAADARTLSLRAEEARADFLERMRRVHAAFVDEFKGILVEYVSDQTIDAMADRPFYEEWANGITSLDMDQKLRQLYSGIYEMNGDIDRAFGAFTTFNELPLESQAMLQEMVMRFESEVKKPFTKEMEAALAKLEAARGKQPASLTSTVKQAAQDLARQAAGA